MKRIKGLIQLLRGLIIIKHSRFFDSAWYKKTYLKDSKISPYVHYLINGSNGKFDPSENFSTSEYYLANPDVRRAGVNALLHYELFGSIEEREIIQYDRLLKRSSSICNKKNTEPYTQIINKKSDIKIFVACKEESYIPDNPLLFPIQTGATLADRHFTKMLQDNRGDNISERNEYYCELTAQYWAWKNIEADYYGFFHNRRYLSFNKQLLKERQNKGIEFECIDSYSIDKLHLREDQMRELIVKYDIIVPRPFNWIDCKALGINRTVMHQYEMSPEHRVVDLKYALDILKKYHPECSSVADLYMKSYKGYQMNIYIMRKEIFYAYCEWLFPVLEEVYETIDLSNRNNYGKRSIGYIAERFWGIYLTYLCEENTNLRVLECQNSFFRSTKPPESIQQKNNDEKRDIKIFVSHRIDLDSETIENPLYYPVRCGAVFDDKTSDIPGDDTGDNISEKRLTYNELTVQYWAWKNVEADYYGLCHYRRYISFSNAKFDTASELRNNGCVTEDYITEISLKKFGLTEDNMRNEISNYDVILCEPIDLEDIPFMKNNYNAMEMVPEYHNMDDVDMAINITKEKYPYMAKTVDRYMNGTQSRLYNCFIMRSDIFKEYSAWLFDILFEVEKHLDMSSYGQQKSRTLGTIGERLFGIYCLYLYEQSKFKIKEAQLVFFENTEKQKILFPAFSNNNIPIVISSSNSFVPYASVLIKSIIEHSSPKYGYDILILEKEISITNKRLLKSMVKNCQNISIRFYNPEQLLSGTKLFISFEGYSKESYYRILVPYILANYNRAIVMDCDLIAKSDIAELFFVDLENNIAAIAPDVVWHGWYNGLFPEIKTYRDRKFHILSPYNYVNTGVILFNLKLFREKYAKDFVINFLAKNDFMIQEQDAINLLLENQIEFLDISWNMYALVSDYIKDSIDNYAPVREKEMYYKAHKDPKLIHWAGHPKPWENPEIDYAEEFWKVAQLTPFYEIIVNRMAVGNSIASSKATHNNNQLQSSNTGRNHSFSHNLVNIVLPKGSRRRKLIKKIVRRSSHG